MSKLVTPTSRKRHGEWLWFDEPQWHGQQFQAVYEQLRHRTLSKKAYEIMPASAWI